MHGRCALMFDIRVQGSRPYSANYHMSNTAVPDNVLLTNSQGVGLVIAAKPLTEIAFEPTLGNVASSLAAAPLPRAAHPTAGLLLRTLAPFAAGAKLDPAQA